jgi:hypothetical protein
MGQHVPATIHVTPAAATVGAHGYPAGSDYVRTFWLPIVGPSSLLAHELLAGVARRRPDGVDLDVDDLAARLGLGHVGGRHCPIARTLRRLGDFGLADVDLDGGIVAVHLALPALHRGHLRRLPGSLRDLHDVMTTAAA